MTSRRGKTRKFPPFSLSLSPRALGSASPEAVFSGLGKTVSGQRGLHALRMLLSSSREPFPGVTRIHRKVYYAYYIHLHRTTWEGACPILFYACTRVAEAAGTSCFESLRHLKIQQAELQR